jgi:AcrR family transcriptional regulator
MDSKTTILHSAIAVFATYGKVKTSMAMIAKHAHVSKPLLFHHFSTKNNLYEETLTYALNAVQSIKLRFMNDETNFFDKMYHVQVAKYELERTIPHIFKFMLMAVPETSSPHEYPFTENDLSLFKPNIDPQFIYQWLYVMSLGYSQLLKDGVSWEKVYQDYAQAFNYIQAFAMKGA